MDKEFEKLRKQWYSDDNVMFNIIDNLKYRETTVIRKGLAHRCLKINAIRYFVANASRYHFFDEEFNLYASLGMFPDLPMFSFGMQDKRKEMDEFNVSFTKYMTGYDFLMDIDNKDLRLAYSTTYKIKKIFDDYKIKYYLLFSGNKGFHFRVDYTDFPLSLKKLKWSELAMKLKRFAESFRAINNFEDIDTTIFDLRRVSKTPYSLVYPNYLVALPLTDKQFSNFSIKEVSLPYWIDRTDKLYKRGNLKREGDTEAFGKLIDDYKED